MIIMNQIFKVVYSAAKQCYVVTSEFAKSNGKKAAVVAAALVLTSGVGAVNAADVDSLDTRLTSLETTVSKINAKVTAGTPGAAANNAQIEENKANIEKNKTEIEAQATRVDKVVDAVSEISTDVEENGKKIDTNASDILTNKEAIAANTTKIGEAIESVNANNEAITTLKASVEKDEEKLDVVDKAVEANRNDIDANSANIETNKAEIAKNAGAIKAADDRITKVKELTAKAITNAMEKLGEEVLNPIATDVAKNEENIEANKKEIAKNAEAIKAADTRITKVKELTTNALTDAMTDLNEKILDPMGKAVEINEKDIAELKEQHSAHETSITNLDNRTTALEAVKGTKEGLEMLKNVEAKVDKNTGDIKPVATGLVKTAEKIDELTDKNAEQDNEISGNAEAIDANTKAIDKNTKAVDEANKKLVEHATVINENTKAINDNVDSINTNAESIAKNTGYIKEIVEKNIELGEAVKENKENIKTVATGLIETAKEIDRIDAKDAEQDGKIKTNTENIKTVATGLLKTAGEIDALHEKDATLEAKNNAQDVEIKAAKDAAKVADTKVNMLTDVLVAASDELEKNIKDNKKDLDDKNLAQDGKIDNNTSTIATNKQAQDAANERFTESINTLKNTTVLKKDHSADIKALQEVDKNHEARLTTVENDVKTVGANAAALAALKPLQYNPGQTTQVMAGVGTYRGKTAVALGAAHYASENLMYHAGVSFGNGNGAMANAGVTIGFGSGEGAKMNSSKVAELQSAVDRLTAENEQVKAALYDIYAKLQAK